MKRPEQIIQQGIFEFLIPLMFYQNYEQFIAFAIRNETGVSGAKGAILGKIAKSMGVMAGVSDFELLFPKRCHMVIDSNEGEPVQSGKYYPTKTIEIPAKSVYVEVKCAKSSRTPETLLNDDQKKFRDRIVKLGFEYRIISAESVNDGIKQVTELLRENGVRV